MKSDSQKVTSTEQTSDGSETEQLRDQLSNLVKEVRCTIAHPARPEGLRDALTQSQDLLR
jgi:hypothetical protein